MSASPNKPPPEAGSIVASVLILIEEIILTCRQKTAACASAAVPCSADRVDRALLDAGEAAQAAGGIEQGGLVVVLECHRAFGADLHADVAAIDAGLLVDNG